MNTRLYTPAAIACEVAKPVADVRKALWELNCKSLWLNYREHYSADDLERVRIYFQTGRNSEKR